jgi:hypothetical protein
MTKIWIFSIAAENRKVTSVSHTHDQFDLTEFRTLPLGPIAQTQSVVLPREIGSYSSRIILVGISTLFNPFFFPFPGGICYLLRIF